MLTIDIVHHFVNWLAENNLLKVFMWLIITLVLISTIIVTLLKRLK